jgi:hypothetical protein
MVNESRQAGVNKSESAREEQLMAALRHAYLGIQRLSEDADRILRATKERLDLLEFLDSSE